MKRLLALALLSFMAVPMASAQSFEDYEDDSEEDDYYYEDHDCDDWEYWDDWDEDYDFEEDKALSLKELEFELHYIEDEPLAASVRKDMDAMETMEEDAFFDRLDEVYDRIDDYWEEEDYEDDDLEEEDELDYSYDTLVQLITEVIMNLKAQGLI